MDAGRGTSGDAARVLASAGNWAFTIALALYAYYEDGVSGVGLAVAVRTLPAALATPYVRRLAARLSPRSAFTLTAAAQALALGAVVLAVAADVPFYVFLALVAGFRLAGAAESSTRAVEEVGFLAGAVAAAVCIATVSLHAVFTMCALAYLAAAVVALLAPARERVDRDTLSLRGALRDVDARRLHLLRGGRAAVRSAVELLLVVAALDLLGMGIAGVGWLSAAWAGGVLVGGLVLRQGGPRASAQTVAVSAALIGVPLALVALSPPALVGVALLAVVGVGFALVFTAEAALERRLPRAALEGEELVDALARTSGAMLAAALVLVVGDAGALVTVGALAAALGVGALGLLEPVRREDPAAALTVGR